MSLPYELDQWMIAWTPSSTEQSDTVEVGPWPDKTGWSDKYELTAGCCSVGWSKLSQQDKFDELFRGFFLLVLRDGVDPKAVHREFSKIKGYLRYRGSVGFGEGVATFFQAGKLDPYNP